MFFMMLAGLSPVFVPLGLPLAGFPPLDLLYTAFPPASLLLACFPPEGLSSHGLGLKLFQVTVFFFFFFFFLVFVGFCAPSVPLG
jgi:hypothetical protein